MQDCGFRDCKIPPLGRLNVRDIACWLPRRCLTHATKPALLGRGNEFLGKLRSCAKEILLHLLNEELLCLRLPGLEPIFIEQHLGVLSPHAPRLGAYVFIDLLAQFGVERAFIQAGKFASQLCAFDHTRHGNIVTRREERESNQCTHLKYLEWVKRVKTEYYCFLFAYKDRLIYCFLREGNMGRSSSTKAEWLGALETAAKLSVEQSSAVWVWLMQDLGLGPQYFLAVREAVQQGRWRTAKNPRTYIKTVAKREAVRMGLVNENSGGNLVSVGGSGSEGEEVSSEEALEYLGHHYDSRDDAKGEDGIWRAGAAGERDSSDPSEEHDSCREWLAAGMPRELAIVTPPTEEWSAIVREMNHSFEGLDLEARPSVRPDWNKWAAAAGLDEWEMKVLGYWLIGIGRRRALAIQTDEESRKALQAAWKRFDRNGMERLRVAAKINIEKNVPESGFLDTSK